MSILHLNRSVLTLHLREILEDGNSGSKVALLGLSAVVFAPVIRSTLVKVGRPLAKAVIKSGFSLYQQSQDTVGEILVEFQPNLSTQKLQEKREELNVKVKA